MTRSQIISRFLTIPGNLIDESNLNHELRGTSGSFGFSGQNEVALLRITKRFYVGDQIQMRVWANVNSISNAPYIFRVERLD